MIFLLRNNDSQSSAWVTCDLTDYPNSKKTVSTLELILRK